MPSIDDDADCWENSPDILRSTGHVLWHFTETVAQKLFHKKRFHKKIFPKIQSPNSLTDYNVIARDAMCRSFALIQRIKYA